MATIPNGYDFGRALIESEFNLMKMAATPRGRSILDYQINPRANFIRDDFSDDTLSTFKWAVDGDTGTTAFAVPAAGSTVAGGSITGSTAADDNEFIAIYGSAIHSGDRNAGFLCTWEVDVVTDICIEMGLSDVITDYTLPAVSDIDTPTITNGAVTVALLAMDTDQTLQTATLLLDGDSTYATSKVDPSVAWSPTAATRYTTIIQTSGDHVWCAILGPQYQTLREMKTTSAAFEGGTLVQPRVTFGNRAGSSAKAPVLYRLWAWSDKA